MDRGWYFRFTIVLTMAVGGWFVLWPSLDQVIPAPTWVKDGIERRISAGLDIQGGLRLMYEVEVDVAIQDRRDRLADRMIPRLGELTELLTEEEANEPTREHLDTVREKITVQKVGDRRIRVQFEERAHAEMVDRDWLRDWFPDLRETSRTDDGKTINFEIREENLQNLREDAVEQAVKTIENRVDEMQIKEMTVIGRDTDIIIEIPGADPVTRVVNSLAASADVLAGSGERPGQEGYLIELDRGELAERTGLSASELDEALGELGAPREGDQPYLVEADGGFRIPDLERFRLQSKFERVKQVVSQTAQLEFKVLEDENTFIQSVELPPSDGEYGEITMQREGTTAGVGRNVTSYYLVARGADSRSRLSSFVATLDVPDDREILLGRLDPQRDPDAEETEEGDAQEAWRTYYLFSHTEVTGEDVEDAYVGTDENQRPVVQLEFNGDGADAFGRMTGNNVKRRMAIILDNRVESAPVINERIGGGRCQITLGAYQDVNVLFDEAAQLVIVLKAGALPAPIRPANEQLIGPTLGRDSVEQGAEGALIGIGLVLLFMLFYYQVAGIVADLMVILNIVMLLATLAFLEATLTLPGIAGIALTVGMAVDANVLITERIREELRLGKSPRSAVDQGFRRAFWSIFDAQLTTFIAGVVLFQYGTGPIKGFAVTLMIGIGTSLFTGVFCSKVLLDWIVRGLRVSRLRVG